MMKALLSVIALGITLSAAPAWTQDQAINITGYAFSPQKLTVTVGTKLTWTNRDQEPHSVMEQDKKFHSAALDTDDSYSFTFTQPGTYHYFCTLHPQMTGTITVVNSK